MDVFEAIARRRSVRKYKSKPVPADLLEKVLESARLAPSTSNTQSWKFKVVTDPGTRKRLRAVAYGQRFIEEAPVVIACCLDVEAFKERGKQMLKLILRGVRPSLEMALHMARGGKDKGFDPERIIINGTMNVAIATEHMILTAESLGLSTCWVRAYDPDSVADVLDLPDGVILVSLLTLGYSDQKPAARPRKSPEEIIIE
jgi:nitroreductase